MNSGETTVATIEVKDGSPLGAIQDVLRSMLKGGVVSAILAPQEIPSKKTVVQALVRDPEKLSSVNPLAPVFSVNSARIITRMCVGLMANAAATSAVAGAGDEQSQSGPADEGEAPAQSTEDTGEKDAEDSQEQAPAAEEPAADEQADEQAGDGGDGQDSAPIGVVLKPCEIRAFVELVKLQQASMDPFLIIGVDCWGTYSVQEYADRIDRVAEGSSVTADFLKQAVAGDIPDDLRGACRVCQYPCPTSADVAIQLIGEDISRQIRVQGHTERGKEALQALDLEITADSDEREDAVAKLVEAKKQLVGQDELDFLETISSLCINCRNCRAVCPICYCKQCVFDGEVFEYPIEKYLTWSEKKGILGMPPDKVLFHLTRMSHVAMSCVACGQCEAACPSGIPLGRMYQKISAAAQDILGYEAGRSLDDELPLTTFHEDELSSVEN